MLSGALTLRFNYFNYCDHQVFAIHIFSLDLTEWWQLHLFNRHSGLQMHTANSILGYIKRNMASRVKEAIILSLLRSHETHPKYCTHRALCMINAWQWSSEVWSDKRQDGIKLSICQLSAWHLSLRKGENIFLPISVSSTSKQTLLYFTALRFLINSMYSKQLVVENLLPGIWQSDARRQHT